MALNNEFKVKNNLNTLGQILSSGVDIASIFAPSNTSWTLTAGEQKFDISGTETLTFQGGNGVAVQALSSTETVVISGINATSTIRGVASFNSDDFTVTDGAVTIKTGGVDNDQLKTATTENSANYVVIRDGSGGFAAGTVTVTGNVSASGHVYAPTIIGPNGNSNEWDHAYDVATTYEQASAGFALSGYNTTIGDTVSSISFANLNGPGPIPASEWKQKTLIQALDTLLFPDIAPSYFIPAITFTSNIASGSKYELGTSISPLLTITATKNDAGAYSTLYFQRNNSTISTVSTPTSSSTTNLADEFGYANPNNPNARYIPTYTDTAFSVPLGQTTWRGMGDYQAGLPKKNNKGVTDTRTAAVRSANAPQAAANSFTSSTVNVNGFYRRWVGSLSALPANPNEIRTAGLTTSLDEGAGNLAATPILINQKVIIVLIPSTRTLTNVVTESNENITANFSLSSVTVNDAGGTGRSYKLYYYETAVPLGINLTTVSIS